MPNEAFVEEQRALLVARLERAQIRLSAVSQHLQRTDHEMPQDFADQATEREGDETLDALEARAREEIAAAREALARMDAGTWGTCVTCGDDIGVARLAAVPDTATCVRCAS